MSDSQDDVEFRRKLARLRDTAIAGPKPSSNYTAAVKQAMGQPFRVTVDADFLLEIIGCAELWLERADAVQR